MFFFCIFLVSAWYYDPRTSVWQSPDPILNSYMDGAPNGGVFTPTNLGLYSYTANNPLNFVDPDGQFWWFVVAAAVGLSEYANAPETENDIYTGPTGAAIVLPLPSLGAGAKFLGVVTKGRSTELALNITGHLKGAAQITKNKAVGKIAEASITKTLMKKYGNGNVYSQITAKFKDGKRVVFDNVVHKNGKLLINETKANGAKLSKNQRRFFQGGESVTFVGEKAKKAEVEGMTININNVETSITKVQVKIKE